MTPAGLSSRSIRRARPGDAKDIEALYRQLVGDTNIRVLATRIAEVADDPRTLLLVLESDGHVCATALLNLCADVMFESQPFAVVENIVVDSRLRGQGLGTLLLQWIEENCRERGCSKIMLLSGAERTEAHRFFARSGFTEGAKKGFVKYRRAFRAAGESA